MLRRTTRLRREYLYRKNLEGKEKEVYEKKRKIKEALAEGKPIPTELRTEEAALRKDGEYDDLQHEAPRSHQDDEYANAAVADPKILITTSHDPSSRLGQFVKELKLIFPNSQRMNRGGHVMKDLVEICRQNDVTDLIIAHETRGEPDGLVVCHLPYGPTAFFNISNAVLRHDIKDKKMETVSEAYPHLIFHNFKTKLGDRTQTILKHLFPVPKDDTKRVMSFVNQNDFVAFRHHTYAKEGKQDVALKELGPRFNMRLYQIRLGTVEQNEAENEWVLHSYTNSAKRMKAL